MIKHALPPRRRLSLKRVVGLLVIVTAVFALGVAVGRGDLHLRSTTQMSSLNKNLPPDLDYTSVEQVYDLLKKDFDGQMATEKLLDGLKTGLVDASGDPYTEYFNPKDAKMFDDALSGSFTGIGAELGTNADDQIVIVSPLAGYPAAKAGLQTKDVITAIDGQSTSGVNVDKAVQKIRGPANTKVTLSISRSGGRPLDVTITRVKIDIPSVEYKMEGNIGYIKINQFNQDTADLARKAAQDFKSKNVKAIALDLRSNPGGYLSDAVDVSSLWLPEGKTVVLEKRGSQVIDTEYSHGASPLAGLSTVVLINGGSASASEITAGALRDNGAATLVGAKSFGKGSVQQVEKLANGGELKITIARWYTPKGANIDKQGIKPDIIVDITEEQAKAGQDPQKDKAYEILKAKL